MEDKIMKKLFTLFLAILCLLTMLSIPVFAADAGVEPYGTPGSGYDQKNFTFNRSTYTAKLYLQFNSSYVAKSRCETVAETQIDHKALMWSLRHTVTDIKLYWVAQDRTRLHRKFRLEPIHILTV